jgi:hypothetical protein
MIGLGFTNTRPLTSTVARSRRPESERFIARRPHLPPHDDGRAVAAGETAMVLAIVGLASVASSVLSREQRRSVHRQSGAETPRPSDTTVIEDVLEVTLGTSRPKSESQSPCSRGPRDGEGLIPIPRFLLDGVGKRPSRESANSSAGGRAGRRLSVRGGSSGRVSTSSVVASAERHSRGDGRWRRGVAAHAESELIRKEIALDFARAELTRKWRERSRAAVAFTAITAIFRLIAGCSISQ